jgi:hypothetical protein
MFARAMRGDVPPSAKKGPLTWEMIEQAIRGLDGQTLTAVLLTGPDNTGFLAVGGGGGHYSVDASLDEIRCFHLMNPNAPQGTVELVAGDQRVRMERKKLADLEDTLRAARAFAIDGVIDSSLSWK